MTTNFKMLTIFILLIWSILINAKEVTQKSIPCHTLNNSQDIRIYTADTQSGKITPKSIKKAFRSAGYIAGSNNMNRVFDIKFKNHIHDTYYLMVVHKKSFIKKLAKKSPNIALFTPFSMSIYTKKDEKTISASSISIAGISKITGIPKNNTDLIAYMKDVSNILAKALPNGKFEKLTYKMEKIQGNSVNKFTMKLDVEDDEIQDKLEGIQIELESYLASGGFVIAGFNRLSTEFLKASEGKYDFFYEKRGHLFWTTGTNLA